MMFDTIRTKDTFILQQFLRESLRTITWLTHRVKTVRLLHKVVAGLKRGSVVKKKAQTGTLSRAVLIDVEQLIE